MIRPLCCLVIVASVCLGVPVARAQDWSSYHSEEHGAFQCKSGFLNAIECNGRYCDNKRYTCNGHFDKARGSGWGAWFTDGTPSFRCPTGEFVDGIECRNRYCDDIRLHCSRLVVPAKSMRSPGQCTLSSRFSEEKNEARGQANAVTLDDHQLISGMQCFGKYCDDLEVRYCEAYAGKIPVAGVWLRIGSASGQPLKRKITTGRSATKEHKSTFSLGLTEGVTAKGGFLEAKVEVSASFTHEFGGSNTSSSGETVDIECAPRSEKDTAFAYQFAMANGQPQVMHRTDHWRCHSVSPDDTERRPQCAPALCADELCQKCKGGAAPLAPVRGVKLDH